MLTIYLLSPNHKRGKPRVVTARHTEEQTTISSLFFFFFFTNK